MEPFSMRERRRIIELYASGYETAEVAEIVGASPAGVRRVRQRHRDEGRVGPRPHGGGQPPATDVGERDRVLRALVAERPDAFARELAEDFHARTGVRVCRQTVGRWLAGLGLTRKKSRSAPASRSARTCGRSARRGSPASPAPAAGTSAASAS
jgi:transposase